MQRSSLKPLRALGLTGAGLALLVLGASTPRLAAQQSDNFDSQSDANWTHYTFPTTNPYGVAVYSFPTNPAAGNAGYPGYAGNYALRIQVPPIVNDTNYPPSLNPRGGEVWVAPNAFYGPGDPVSPAFYAAADLVAWNTDWSGAVLGVGWDVPSADFSAIQAYFSGWGAGVATLGITRLDKNASPPYAIIGQVINGTTVLNTSHQYRMTSQSFDGGTFLVQIFDRAQTNTAWQSAICQDWTYNSPGYCGLVVANEGCPPPNNVIIGTDPNTTQGADATFDNYYAWKPTAGLNPAQLPAVVSDTYPPPNGQPAEYYPTVSVSILDEETAVQEPVNANTFLYLDGNLLTSGVNYTNKVAKPIPSGGNSAPNDDGSWYGATLTYSNGVMYAAGSWHTNKIVFLDDQNVWHTNSWWWQAASPSLSLYASNSLPIGSLSVRGFQGRTVVTPGPFDNSLPNAFMVLDYPATNASAVTLAATNITQLVAWDIGDSGWHWGAVTNYPGLCYPTVYPNYFACQVQAYLRLTNGIHRFHVDSDDGVAIYSGTDVNDTSAPLLVAANNGGAVTHADFDIYVPADGLYPFNIIHEEGNGDAYLCLYEAYLSSPTAVTNLVNGSASTVAAFYPLPAWKCTASGTVKTSYSPVAATVTASSMAMTTASAPGDLTGSCVNQTVTSLSGTNTITVTPAGSPMFYRLSGGPGSSKILSCTKSGANLAITYRWQNP